MDKEKIKKSVKIFVDEYFEEVKKVSNFHLQFFNQNSIDTTDINMLALKDIIFRALNFLQNIDDGFFSKLLRKMYFDIKDLLEFLNNFEKNSKVLDNLFENQFLHKFQMYKDLKEKIELTKTRKNSQRTIMVATDNELKYFKPKTKAEIHEYNKLRGRNVDAVHRYSKAKEDIQKLTIELKNLKEILNKEFKIEFQKAKDLYLGDLIIVINTKLFYFNKLMWQEANKNEHIKDYFSNLGIKNFDLNTYAKSYMKHINILKSSNIEKLEKIEEALKNLR